MTSTTKYQKPSEGNRGNFNNIPCSCGKHFGTGVLAAEQRARVYAWFRDKYPSSINWDVSAKEWLASYQREHGHQLPNI